MSKEHSRKSSLTERNDIFNVKIIGYNDNDEALFSKTFPILLDDSKMKHKYLKRFDLSLRETIIIPKNFANIYHPEILDKINSIDILILTYNLEDNLSFEYLKTFYYLYYVKLEENDRPKNIIVIERDYIEMFPNNISQKVDSNSGKELAQKFNGYFCDYETDEEKLTIVLSECVDKLLKINNYKFDYSFFKYKQLNKRIDCNISVYGDKISQETFLRILLESKLNYRNIKKNTYEIIYELAKDGNNYSFKVLLNLMNIDYYYDSECNILIYDINKIESYNLIRSLIRKLVVHNESKFKKSYNLFPFNFDNTPFSENENNNLIKEGKILASELGANFSIININNNINLREEIKNKFVNLLEQTINIINISQSIENETKSENNSNILELNIDDTNEDKFVIINDYVSTGLSLRQINNKIKNDLNNNISYLLNICPTCYKQLSIKINEKSNIIIIYCDKCKSEPKGVNIEQFLEFIKKNNTKFKCDKCEKCLFYEFKSKKLFCNCQVNINDKKKQKNKSGSENLDNFLIPVFLKDSYCEIHNKFYQYYLKYSKKGFCETCLNEENQNNSVLEEFAENDIINLVNKKKEELNKERKFIAFLQEKINECIMNLKIKYDKIMKNKMKIHLLKSDLINSLQVLQNNHTIISNVKSLKFDDGNNFIFKEDDSIENKLKYLKDYFNNESSINNFCFGKKHQTNDKINIKGPFDILTQNEKKIKVTDACTLKNNELICISFNNGKAKIYDSNKIESNNYPECVINEFSPNQGIHSLYISKDEDTIWKTNNTNKNEIIYLNGFEEIKIIQMNYDYTDYVKLYVIKEECKNISYSIELDYNKILLLTTSNNLYIINLYKDINNEIKTKKTNVYNLLVESNKSPTSIRKITKNIICLDLIHINDFELDSKQKITRTTFLNEKIKRKKNAVDDDDITNSYTLNDDDLAEEDDDNNNNEKCTVEEDNNYYYSKTNQFKKNEKYIKLFSLNFNNDKNKQKIIKDKDGNCLDIKKTKEYIFPNNYEILGILSEEKNLLLLHYIKEDSNNFAYLFIFDLNIFQFINIFKFHDVWTNPKYFVNINSNQEFIIFDEDLNMTQYLYDENYTNKIYYINIIKKDKNLKSNPDIILGLKDIIIMISKHNNYYILNN